MTSLGIKSLIFITIGLIAYLYFKLSNLHSKNSGKKVLKKCKEDFEYAKRLSESLNLLLHKKDLNEHSFSEKITLLQENFQLGNNRILLSKRIDTNNYLLVTYCSDLDYNIALNGKAGDVNRLYHFNYRIHIDGGKQLLKGYSDGSVEKIQETLKENFLIDLFKYLQGS
jgi:hypothetical protein